MLRLFPLLLVLALAPTPLIASVVKNLYSASVPVASQSDQARSDALHKALREVIVKVTGSRSAPDDAQVAAILSRPEHYLQAYRYQRHVPGPNEPIFRTGATSALELSATFDRRTLDRALSKAGQPLWGSERPATIVWIAYQKSDGERRILGAEASGRVRHGVHQGSTGRGVPVMFPLMDVRDRADVSFSDVWGGFNRPVVQASRRYQPNAILVGRIAADGANSSARWQLIVGDQTTSWDGGTGKPAALGRAAIQHLADLYASKFVIQGGAGGQTIPALDVVVTGIGDLTGYGRTLHYLRSLNALGNVEPMEVGADVVTFEASAQGTVRDLKQTIGLGDVLEEDGGQSISKLPKARSSSRPVTLHYRYQG